MTPLESAFATLVLAALTRWLAKVTKAVMFPWRSWSQVPDPSGVRQFDDVWAGEVTRLVSWLQQKAVGTPGASAAAENHLNAVRNLLVRIPDEVFQDIRRELIEGNNQGESIRAIAERVDKVLDTSGSEQWKNRAQVIAVTEVNGASNAGWYAKAISQQAQLNRPLAKRWIATHDSHTRLDHREADGQVVPLLSPFIVGTWPLLYPGDKNGPPEQVIHCRCTAAIVEDR